MSLTAVPGVRVGHATHATGTTGCTVVLTEGGAIGAACVRGAAASMRQFGSLMQGHLSAKVHGVLLTGGSAFGLDAAAGAMSYLEQRGVGLATPGGPVPVIPTLVIFDLTCGASGARPDAAMAFAACESADRAPVAEGSLGAGAGATIGKLGGVPHATKGGVGTASEALPDGTRLGALVIANPFGDIIDPRTKNILAGARATGGGFLDTAAAIRGGALEGHRAFTQNTTLAVVATDAKLAPAELHRAVALAANALPRCISPVHTLFDGDVVVGLSTGQRSGELHQIGLCWEELLVEAIMRAVIKAESVAGVPAHRDLTP